MSEVTICNLALGHLGDKANVASIRPPESSVQAQLCARFYPIARNALLEMAAWGFATRRVRLAQVALPDEVTTWAYAYTQPSPMINALAVLDSNAADDFEVSFVPSADSNLPSSPQGYVPIPGARTYTPQPYTLETTADGKQLVLTNVQNAIFRYTTLVEDTSKFSPLFIVALSYLLASMLAGPIIKGDEGAKKGAAMLTFFNNFKNQAEASDANQRKTDVQPAVSWIRGR